MLLVALAALAVFAPNGRAWAQGLVVWGGSGTATAAQGELDPSLIPISTGTTPVRYTNINGEGFDMVVTTSGFVQSGKAVLPWNTTTGWYFEGGCASKQGNSIPYSTVTFKFYQTGTNTPVAVSGLKFRFEDAEIGERLRSFSFTDAAGNSITPSYTNYAIFSYVYGYPNLHLSDNSLDTGAPYEGGTQEGKWMAVDLSPYAVSAFTFQAGRVDSNYGSIVLTFTDTGVNLQKATDLIIGSGIEQDVTGNPAFESGTDGANAFLPAVTLMQALDSSDSSVTTRGTSQVIALYDSIADGSGNSLTMTATQSIVPSTANIDFNTTGLDGGNVNLTAGETVQLGQILTSATNGNAGAINIAAGNDIYLGTGVDSSASTVSYTGGNITMTAGGDITIPSITTAGHGSVPGNISLTASGTIEVPVIEDDSGTGDSTQATLTAPVINIGTDGDITVDIQGTLSLNQPASGGGATGTISGIIQGPGGLVINTGSGTVTMDEDQFYSGETDVQSGTLDPQGGSLVNSDLVLEGTSVFEPGVQAAGGSSGAQSLTMAPYSTLDIQFYSGGYNDQVDIVGAANLSGILNVTLPPGFNPALGTVFPVLSFGNCTAQFGSYQGVRYGGMVLEPVFTGTSMVLVTSTVATGASQPLQTVPGGGIFVPAGGYYDGLITTNSNSFITAATIIDGTASQDTTVTMTIKNSGGGVAVGGISGPVLDLQGTGMDKYVIQLDYNEAEALAIVGDERNLYIASSDGGVFENAVFANTDLPGEPNNPMEFFGPYDPSADFHLGYYGVDTINNRVWAVLDHNSSFGVGTPGAPVTQSGPVTATEPASHVMAASCNLNAEVDPNGDATTVVFELGSNPTLSGASVIGSSTLAGAGITFAAVTSPVTGLAPQTTYYFRADAVSSSGTTYGAIQQFTTPQQPSVTVTASTPNAYLQGLTPGSFTISQNGTANVTVQYAIGGTGTNGSAYRLFSGPVSIAAGSSSFTLDVIPLAQGGAVGDQAVTVTIVPDANYTVSGGGATVTIHDTPQNDWKLANFGANANTSSVGGDLAINNTAGITNLMAYGLGLSPASAQTSALPAPGLTILSGSGYLTLSFTRNAAATDLTYTVQGSSDMVNWTPISVYSGGAWSSPGNVLETGSTPLINVEAWDTVPETSGSARFLRLQITN